MKLCRSTWIYQHHEQGKTSYICELKQGHCGPHSAMNELVSWSRHHGAIGEHPRVSNAFAAELRRKNPVFYEEGANVL